MSVDDFFQAALRTAACLVWAVRLWQITHGSELRRSSKIVGTACLVLIAGVIALGGWAIGLRLVAREVLAVIYTATSVVVLAGGLVTWRS